MWIKYHLIKLLTRRVQSKLILETTLSIEDVPMRIIMRSIMPGHEHCENYSDPVPPYHRIAIDPCGERKTTYGWHLFPEFNAITKRDFSHASRNDIQIEYWDVWKMGAVRPDAHVAWVGSFFDCLHVRPSHDIVLRVQLTERAVVSDKYTATLSTHVVAYNTRRRVVNFPLPYIYLTIRALPVRPPPSCVSAHC